MKYFSHLNTAVQALEAYDGKVPFHHYIREFLKLDKKYGSKDRKNISRLCYAGLRVGNAFKGWTAENRIRAGLFLCTAAPDAVTKQLIGDYNEVISESLPKKWQKLTTAYAAELADKQATGSGIHDAQGDQSQSTASQVTVRAGEDPLTIIFPLPVSVLSPSLHKEAYLFSFFVQPDLFLRIRPGKKEEVIKQLESAGVDYSLLPPASLRLPINTKLEELFEQDRGVVVQDYSSQRTGAMMELVRKRLADKIGSLADEKGPGTENRGSAADDKGSAADQKGPGTENRGSLADDKGSAADQKGSSTENRGSLADDKGSTADDRALASAPVKIWDACAASGGKSILLSDIFSNMQLTVTDIRPTIIHNLARRFQYAGVKNYQSFVADLSAVQELPFRDLQDLVVADVPCSGSGTWSRTPEQLILFKPVALENFQQLQQKILKKIIPMIKPGGYLLYITCSVFEKENEDNSQFVQAKSDLQLVHQELIVGYHDKADTMFTALFCRQA